MVKAPYAKLYSIIKTQTMSADSEQCDEVGISLILGYILHEKAVHPFAPLDSCAFDCKLTLVSVWQKLFKEEYEMVWGQPFLEKCNH